MNKHNLSRTFTALPGLLLAAALLVLFTSSLLRYAAAVPFLPMALRTFNIATLHQFAADLSIAMTLLGATQASRAPMSRPLVISGLIFSALLLMTSVAQLAFSVNETRTIFWLIPLSALIMAAGFLHQLRAAATSVNRYFPVNMTDGGIKTALMFGASACIFALYKLGAQSKILAQFFFDSLDQFTLMCIPFLVLAGVLLNPQRRSGQLVPFALLALWLAAVAGIGPGKFIFALIIPGAMIAMALWLSGAKNIVFAQHKPVQSLLMHVVILALFIGSFIQAFVSFTEGAALAALVVGISSVCVFRRVKKTELVPIFSYSAIQSAAWLFTGAAAMLWVQLWGSEMAWLSDISHSIQALKIAPGLILLSMSVPVCIACYLIGPIAAIMFASALLLPLTTSLGLNPMQSGVFLLICLVWVKVFQTNRADVQMVYPHFNRDHALVQITIVLALVALIPVLSLRLPLLMFGPGL